MDIVIISYNNYKLVDNTIKQLLNKKNINIIIIDNNSDDIDTIIYLNNAPKNIKIFFNKENNGPWISESCNKDIYDSLPDKFIITDPDLEFNENLPENFIEILSKLSDNYKVYKIGFALDISEPNKLFQNEYFYTKNIYDTELNSWKNKIIDENYELYNVDIDTTFCLVNKLYSLCKNNCIRVAGNFTAKHLPWYIDNKIYNLYENYITYKKTTKISTISKVIINYI